MPTAKEFTIRLDDQPGTLGKDCGGGTSRLNSRSQERPSISFQMASESGRKHGS
jgi:hypothetical protein